MTNKTKNLLKERSKLTKFDCEKALEKSAECTREILKATNSIFLK